MDTLRLQELSGQVTEGSNGMGITDIKNYIKILYKLDKGPAYNKAAFDDIKPVTLKHLLWMNKNGVGNEGRNIAKNLMKIGVDWPELQKFIA